MSFRIEEKILVNENDNFLVKKFLKLNSAKKLYNSRVVKSLYFDNNSFDMFQNSEEGIVPRKKIRIRSYPKFNNKFFLEIKISSVEGRFKKSNEISETQCLELIKNGIFDKQYGHCKPKIYVKYLREYYIMKDTRITYDKDIEYLNVQQRILGKENSRVLELKPNKDKNTDELFLDFPFSRIRYSKYCFGINKFQYRNGKK
tara:strand:+ start:2779 stop:3381 length:603 start_codon:yes stop_codon:yes gene_type:complete